MSEQPLILVVDDEAEFRDIFSTKLGSVGYRVETAQNGAEGIEKAKRLKPALILMDVNMPIMDGATAVLKLREDPDPAIQAIKIAFLTNLGEPRLAMPDEKYSEDFGAQGYLRKTDNLESLVEKIKGFIG